GQDHVGQAADRHRTRQAHRDRRIRPAALRHPRAYDERDRRRARHADRKEGQAEPAGAHCGCLEQMLFAQNQRQRRTRSLPSPLWGGWRAKRAGWGSCGHARASPWTTTPTPNPSPQGGGEQTERAALFCVKSKGPRFNSGRARRGGTVSTRTIPMPHEPSSRWLVSTDWLADRLGAPDIVVVDGSSYLA